MPYSKSFAPKKAGFKPAGAYGAKPSYGATRTSFGTKPAYSPIKRFGAKPAYGAAKTGFGPSKPWQDREERPSFEATCDVCHKDCRVPFRPNGSKPVLCTNCFKKDRGAETTYSGRRAAGHEETPGAFGNRARPSFAPVASPYAASAKLEKRLDAIETKLDTILKKLGVDGLKAALGEDEESL